MAASIAKIGGLALLDVFETLHGPSAQSDLTALANLIISHTTNRPGCYEQPHFFSSGRGIVIVFL